MSKVTEERLRVILEGFGLEWGEIYDDLTGNEDTFSVADDGLLRDETSWLKHRVQHQSEMLTDLWTRVDRLLDYLGLEDVTIPPKTKIRKKPNPKDGGR